MEFWKKKDEIRVSPSDPGTHPDYKRAKKVGEENFRKMKFESEGAKRDYMRAVESNPNNVVGLPAFYPALNKTFSFSGGKNMSDTEKVEKFMYDRGVRDTDLFCNTCQEITIHSISPDQCFCKKCGNQSRWRSVAHSPIATFPR